MWEYCRSSMMTGMQRLYCFLQAYVTMWEFCRSSMMTGMQPPWALPWCLKRLPNVYPTPYPAFHTQHSASPREVCKKYPSDRLRNWRHQTASEVGPGQCDLGPGNHKWLWLLQKTSFWFIPSSGSGPRESQITLALAMTSF